MGAVVDIVDRLLPQSNPWELDDVSLLPNHPAAALVSVAVSSVVAMMMMVRLGFGAHDWHSRGGSPLVVVAVVAVGSNQCNLVFVSIWTTIRWMPCHPWWSLSRRC